jgi:hypothetical protein
MAKIEKSKVTKKFRREEIFPLGRTNFLIIGIGVIVIVLGYVALSGSTLDGFAQLTVAPILLVLGYCVIIPVGIMYRGRKKRDESAEVPTPAA